MTEYLIDVMGYSYDRILSDNNSEDDVFKDMLQWRNENQHSIDKQDGKGN